MGFESLELDEFIQGIRANRKQVKYYLSRANKKLAGNELTVAKVLVKHPREVGLTKSPKSE